MKIVITGAKGQLGGELLSQLKAMECSLGKLPNIYENATILPIDIDDLDITNGDAVREFFTTEKPDLVLHCAAMTNVDGCEDREELAYKINATAQGIIAGCCGEISAKLLCVSTDYVFDGNGKEPYKEGHACDPKSVYGKSKLQGEILAKEATKELFIVRTSWVYGNGHNFVKTIIRNGIKLGKLKVVNDQVGNPTSTVDLSYHILKLVASEKYGTYHCTGNGICSWYEFAQKIIEFAGVDCEVNPCKTGEFPAKAPRPAYSALSHHKLDTAVGDEMREWQDALYEYISKTSVLKDIREEQR